MTTYPTAREYIKAVQEPGKVFTAPELRGAEFAVDPLLHVPRPGVGASAVVFRATIHGRDEALRFFTRADASDRERHQKLSGHIAKQGLADCLAASSWHDDAITVNGRKWPLVRMEWIDGRPLDKYTEALVERGDTAALGGLAELWRRMVQRLQGAQFAHGDLQHGNVFVDQSSRLRLVDLDGCWVPSLQGQRPPSEHGHPNYQRPSRQWDRWMDTFPSLVVYLSLRALAKDPAPWEDLYVEDNLLFKEDDFATPGSTGVWRHLRSIGDAEVATLADRLQYCCDPRWSASGPLEALLGTMPAPRRPAVRAWWEETAAATVPAAPPLAAATTGVKLPPPPRQTAVPPPFVPAPPRGRPVTPPWGAQPLPIPMPRVPGNWWENPPAGAAAPPPGPHPSTGPQQWSQSSTGPVRKNKTGENFGWALLIAVGSGVATAGAGEAALIIAFIVGVFAFILLSFFRS